MQTQSIKTRKYNSLYFYFPTHSLNKILKVKVTTARSKVKLRCHHDVALIHLPTNVATKYQLHTQYFKGQGHYGKVKGQIIGIS